MESVGRQTIGSAARAIPESEAAGPEGWGCNSSLMAAAHYYKAALQDYLFTQRKYRVIRKSGFNSEEGDVCMLTSAVMNGLVIWFLSLIDWFKRVYYRMKGAVCVQGAYQAENSKKGSRLFSVDYEGKSIVLKYCSQYRDPCDNYRDGDITTLYWIPGKSNAMLFDYKTDKRSLDWLFAWDAASIIAFITLIIALIVQSQVSSVNDPSAYRAAVVVIIASIALMIAAGLFRRFRLKK